MYPGLLKAEDDLWVLLKPAGMAVHPTEDAGEEDLLSWARRRAGAPAGIAPVHRLDRETSGLLLCSPDAALRAALGHWFATGQVKKEYRALCHGHTHKKGTVRRPLADPRRGRGLAAVTRYRRITSFGRVSYLAVRPETGRRHQIRRHLQGIGHPLVGDERYPPRRFRPVPGFPGRLWLHCCGLALPDGREFWAPLPDELQAHLELLEAGRPGGDGGRGEGTP